VVLGLVIEERPWNVFKAEALWNCGQDEQTSNLMRKGSFPRGMDKERSQIHGFYNKG